jgi:hypothetical protein
VGPGLASMNSIGSSYPCSQSSHRLS